MKTLIALLLACLPIYSQSAAPFRSMRYEDDLSTFKSDTARSVYRDFKYRPVFGSGGYLSFGGEIRAQYFSIRHEDWGEAPADNDGYLLTRALLHADARLSCTFRVFAQLQYSFSESRPNPDALEANPPEIHQAFADYRPLSGPKRELVLRAGRQEMLFGAQRLVSAREFPNSRLAFDGIRLLYAEPRLKIQTFYVHPVRNRPGAFDDRFFWDNIGFWGSHASLSRDGESSGSDLYYFGLQRRAQKVHGLNETEWRHTFGARLFRYTPIWRYDLEAAWQTGHLGTNAISAWMLSADVGYTFQNVPLKPAFGLRADAFSGDADPDDRRRGMFDALFPRGSYFGFAGLIGPGNLLDLHPSLELQLAEQFQFSMDYALFRRFSANDGIYAPNGRPLYAAGQSRERHIGNQYAASLMWKPSAFALLKAEALLFDAGAFLKDSGPGETTALLVLTTQIKF